MVRRLCRIQAPEFRRANRTPLWGVPWSLGAAPTGVTPSIVATEEGLR